MATKKGTATKGGKASTEPPLLVSIAMGAGDDIPSQYVNHIEIAHTIHDITLTAGVIPPKHSPEKLENIKASGLLLVEPVIKMTFPPTILDGLIDALQKQRDKQKVSIAQHSAAAAAARNK